MSENPPGPITPYPEVNQLIQSLLDQHQQILGAKLVGIYVFGSLVVGDFDPRRSDVDLLVALTTELDDREFDQLQQMHQIFANQPEWFERIEMIYLSLPALKTFKTQVSPIVITSPGEPFSRIEAGSHYLINWYVVQEQGLTLFGPPPSTIIDPISKAEFIEVVADHARQWREWVLDSGMRRHSAQAYSILTLCRALYGVQHGQQISKRQAGLWAVTELPAWSALINKALVWHAGAKDAKYGDPEVDFPETVKFVNVVVDQIEGKA